MESVEYLGAFRLTQSDACFKLGRDSVLLAEFATVRSGWQVCDLGCGVGSLLLLLSQRVPNLTRIGVELDPVAADLARRNLADNGLTGTVLTGDLRDADRLFDPEDRFDVIVSNPPYVTAEEMEHLEPELYREPRTALTDEGDGLSLIRAIIGLYPDRLNPGGVLLIEHGWRQAEAVRDMAEHAGLTYAPIRDYGGNTRAAEMRKKT